MRLFSIAAHDGLHWTDVAAIKTRHLYTDIVVYYWFFDRYGWGRISDMRLEGVDGQGDT